MTETETSDATDGQDVDVPSSEEVPTPPDQSSNGHETSEDKESLPERVAGSIIAGITPVVITLVALLATAGPAVNDLFGPAWDDLEVIAAVGLTATHLTVSGAVFDDESLVPNAKVWAIASDEDGNRYNVGVGRTDSLGSFTLGSSILAPDAERQLSDTLFQDDDTVARTNRALSVDTAQERSVSRVRVSAVAVSESDSSEKRGRTDLALDQDSTNRFRWVRMNPVFLFSIPMVFILSIVLGLIQHEYRRFRYYTAVTLAFVLTALVIWGISDGIQTVRTQFAQDEVITLGFANVYRGTFVAGVEEEWLFSFTSPSLSSGSENGVANGFGAPLWVLLLSVLGAAVFTIALIVRHLEEPADLAKEQVVQTRVMEVIKHQFYIVFAPLGAVLVYQLLVVADTANGQVTVAMAALAAGVAVNLVLDRALAGVRAILSSRGNG